ncbi:MAG: DUF484 family protein [Herbaspirillum sp.]
MTTHLDSDSIADYLLDHPRFFEKHAELLSLIRLTSPLLGRTVSLQERQMEILREKIKVQELRMADLLRIAQKNDEITSKFLAWTRALLLARNDADLPRILTDHLQKLFDVPQVTVRLWNIAERHHGAWFNAAVPENARLFANGLNTPFCGASSDFEADVWLEDPVSVKSVALLPLRVDAALEAFGLLVLGSPDPDRFTAEMGTSFLERISETASAALACLLR